MKTEELIHLSSSHNQNLNDCLKSVSFHWRCRNSVNSENFSQAWLQEKASSCHPEHLSGEVSSKISHHSYIYSRQTHRGPQPAFPVGLRGAGKFPSNPQAFQGRTVLLKTQTERFSNTLWVFYSFFFVGEILWFHLNIGSGCFEYNIWVWRKRGKRAKKTKEKEHDADMLSEHNLVNKDKMLNLQSC